MGKPQISFVGRVKAKTLRGLACTQATPQTRCWLCYRRSPFGRETGRACCNLDCFFIVLRRGDNTDVDHVGRTTAPPTPNLQTI